MIRDRIYDMLRLRNMTIDELAIDTGLTKGSIRTAMKQTGRVRADVRFIRKIANSLGCTVGWLLQDREWLDRE